MRKFQLKFLVAEKISPYKQLLAGPKLIHHHKLLKRPTKELTSEQRLGNTLTTLVHHSVLYTGGSKWWLSFDHPLVRCGSRCCFLLPEG
jgi:hypothetical protein